MATFGSLGVPAQLVAPLARSGVQSPFPIQSDTLPDTLAGRDVLGRGRTGSGKTLAFALPLVSRLAGLVPSGAQIPRHTRAGHPRGLVLAPTRELANQIRATIDPLAAAAGLSVMTIFGGVRQSGQVRELRRGTDIVVATPGRLEDLMGQGLVHLDEVVVTVLDEADQMADLGFLPSVTRILAATPSPGQRMLFSATLDHGIDKLVKRFLTHPVLHSVDSELSPVTAMTHHVFLVADAGQKRQILHDLAAGTRRRLLFTRTKHQARKLARELTADGIPAVEMHGNLSQGARERGLKAFSEGDVKVMVATDIAARGIHVDDIDLVVHVDPPVESKAYLHRSGRTARAGHEGDVLTLVLPEQRRDFAAVARAAKIHAVPEAVQPGDPRVSALVGDRALPVPPAAAPAAAAQKPSARPGQSSSPARSSPARASQGRSSQGRSSQGRSSRGRSSQSRPSQAAPSAGGPLGPTSQSRSRRPGGRADTASHSHSAADYSRQGPQRRRGAHTPTH